MTMMKTHLSHILPVGKACEILGHDTVYRIGSSFIKLKESITSSSNNTNRPITPTPTTTTASDDDIRFLCNALCYQGKATNNVNTDGVEGMDDSTSSSGAPDSKIIHAWKKWLTHPQLIIDSKALFVQFIVPSTVQPHPGPTGHMGLFDCWIYALQGPAASNSNTANTISNSSYYYTGSSNNSSTTIPSAPTIWIPDILILFAVTKDYQDFRIRQKQKIVQYRKRKQKKALGTPLVTSVGNSESQIPDSNDETMKTNRMIDNVTDDSESEDTLKLLPADRKIVWAMATLSYRIYDSYQKKGVVQRETLHRFLTDVHGEDSYKNPKTKALLDVIFYAPKVTADTAASPSSNAGNSYLQVNVSEQQFCKRVLDTIRIEDIQTTHLLLDWIASLACCMNVLAPTLPKTVSAYIETISRHEMKKPVCQLYSLAENRLYEIKRRFHSMVAKSASSLSIIHGHPMTSATTESGAVPLAAPPAHSDSAILHAGSNKIISGQYFVQALSGSNEELGSGGYLPAELTRLVFTAGCRPDGGLNCIAPHEAGGLTDSYFDQIIVDNATVDSYGNDCVTTQSQSVFGWGLYNVLQFGCMAVRHDSGKPQDPDSPLLQFLFRMFQLAAPPTENDRQKKVLSRAQVGKMLQLLAEYAVYRRRADCPPISFEDDEECYVEVQTDQQTAGAELIIYDLEKHEKSTMVDVAACALLGLIPPDCEPPATPAGKSKKGKHPMVPLKVLVDYALDGSTVDKDQMTFDEFCTWHSTKMTETGPRTRLGPLMTELRLIAAVQFGIPPVLASMEITLIAEIERRHKLRYPQTEMSRRGPRGTVWYIIDSLWFMSWSNLVKKTAGTPIDNQDGRGSIHNPDRSRTLNRIRNAGLLVDDGSLAIRADVRWKHDYEILPPLAWSALQAWYDGGPPIFRTVVKYVPNTAPSSPHSSKLPNSTGMIPTENEIELYPLFVTVYLCDASSRGEPRPFQQNFQLSRVSPILVMLVQLCKELDINPDQARLWVMGNRSINSRGTSDSIDNSNTSSALCDDGSVSKGGGFSPNDDWILSLEFNIIEQIKRRGMSSIGKDSVIALLLELKDRDSGLWPRGADGKEWAFRREKIGGSPDQTNGSDLGDGIVGLYNMGNTCYLNASIQCLSHTPIFREYFTSKSYLNDINTTNPLGHEGRLAQVTAMLINSLWKRFNNQANDPTQHHKRVTAPGSYALVTAPALTPKTFKESLSKFNEHFQGNEQHDAQEMLAFLLGGLSEDLNRIVDKPYIEAPDSDGRPDSELADIWWSNHLKRELSIIVALFSGQYKSLLTCRTCKYESARFEPFSFLQVPLPEDDNLTVTLILYPTKENASAIQYCIRVRNDGRLRDVLIELAKVLHHDELEENSGFELIAETKPLNPEEISDEASETSAKDDSIHVQRAQNLAVVDMKDGYISKIAPITWLLQDLQNKDTGEIPTLHVFELDPLPDVETSKVANTAVSHDALQAEIKVDDAAEKTDAELEVTKLKQAYLAIAQRKAEVMSSSYLHPLVHRAFGTPLLLRVHDLDNYTGRELYDTVAKRLKNVVSRPVHRFLSPQHPKDALTINDEKDSANDSRAGFACLSLKVDDRSRALNDVCTSVFRTLTDMEDVAAGPLPRYGFRLRITTRDGRRCPSCPWYECCIGCLVPDDDKPTVVMDGDSVVVDWHFAVDLATVGFGRRILNPTDFGQPSSPRQLRNMTSVTIKNHYSCGTGVNKKNGLQQPGAVTLEECLDAFAKEERIPEAYCSKCKDFRVQTKRMSLWRLPPVMIIHLKRFQFTQLMRRKLRDLVVFPIEGLDLSRIMAPASDAAAAKKTSNASDSADKGEAIDMKNGCDNVGTAQELKDDGRSEMLYDLYGVVHHQGALSGGHYVASLKSELDGQFRLFNDAQIYEIHSRDVVDASAYILFYIRRDAAKGKLNDFWKVREGTNTSMSEEDMDQLIKGRNDRCVIS